MMMSVYLSSIMRTVVALHSLIENKEERALAEATAAAAEAKALEDAAKEKADKEAAAEKGTSGKDKENGSLNGAAPKEGK